MRVTIALIFRGTQAPSDIHLLRNAKEIIINRAYIADDMANTARWGPR